MNMKNLLFLVVLTWITTLNAQITKNFDIDGVERKAIIYEPAIKTKKTPVIFVFHGHGSNANFVSRRIDIQNYYKDALFIFMQGFQRKRTIQNL